MNYPYPGSIPASPAQGSSIVENATGVKRLQPP